jgi:hypothetical protein
VSRTIVRPSTNSKHDDMRTVRRQALQFCTTHLKITTIDHDKRQPSTSLSGGKIHFLSSCSLTTCNDIIFIHHGASLKEMREFLVEKDALSCRWHVPRLDFREIVSLSTRS